MIKKEAGSFNARVGNLIQVQCLKNISEKETIKKNKPTPKNENSKRTKNNRKRITRFRKIKEDTKKAKFVINERKTRLFKLAKGKK